MVQIPDDPIIACMERTGYPPWMNPRWSDDEEDDWGDEDVYTGNETSDY